MSGEASATPSEFEVRLAIALNEAIMDRALITDRKEPTTSDLYAATGVIFRDMAGAVIAWADTDDPPERPDTGECLACHRFWTSEVDHRESVVCPWAILRRAARGGRS